MDNLENAIEIVKNGGVIIFPTDTAFGVGCRIDNEEAVARLFVLRKRSLTKAAPVLASSIEMVEEYVEKIEPDVRKLMKTYWPGGLTIVLQSKKNRVNKYIRGGGDNIGIRIPNNKIVLELIKQVGVPILAPSANFSGDKTPYSKSDIDPALASLVDAVIDGECTVKQASTVIDCTVQPFKIIREGAVILNKQITQ